MFNERSPRRSASSSRTGPPSATRERSSRRASARSAAPTPSSAAIETIVAGSASRHSAMPDRRAERPRADEPPVLPRQPAHAEGRHRDRQQRRAGRPRASPASATGSLSRSIPAARRNGRLRSCARTPSPRTGSTGGRWVSSRRLAWRRSPSASRHVRRAVPGQDRQADPQRVSTRRARARRRSPADTSGPGRGRRRGTAARDGRRAGAARGPAPRSGRPRRDVAARAQGLDLERRVGGVGEPADADGAESLCASIW